MCKMWGIIVLYFLLGAFFYPFSFLFFLLYFFLWLVSAGKVIFVLVKSLIYSTGLLWCFLRTEVFFCLFFLFCYTSPPPFQNGCGMDQTTVSIIRISLWENSLLYTNGECFFSYKLGCSATCTNVPLFYIFLHQLSTWKWMGKVLPPYIFWSWSRWI